MIRYPTNNNDNKKTLLVKTSLHNEEVIKQFGLLENKKFIGVIDLELTCWDEKDPNRKPRDRSEIIEIGIVILDAKTYAQVLCISTFCKPTYYPEISEYCTNLTTITQTDVNSVANVVVEFSKVEDTLEGFIGSNWAKDFIWAAWGNDVKWLETELNSKIYKEKQKRKLDPRVINFKEVTRDLGFKGGLKKCLEKLKIPQEQPAHRALSDAKSTAVLYSLFKLTPLDAQVSNDKTYSEALKKKKNDIVTEFSRKTSVERGKCIKLLKYVDWDFTIALNIVNLLS